MTYHAYLAYIPEIRELIDPGGNHHNPEDDVIDSVSFHMESTKG